MSSGRLPLDSSYRKLIEQRRLRDTASPVPEVYFLPAPCRGWTRAGEKRVQDNLHAHAQNEPIKNYQVSTTLLVSLCRAMPFSARALKVNIFFDVDIVIKNIKNMVYRGLYSYRQRVRVITLFPNIFFVLFLYVEPFCKSFERKVWRLQVAHLHNAARALSSPSRCFQLSTNLGKDFFRYLW